MPNVEEDIYQKCFLVEYCLKGRSHNLFEIYDAQSVALSLERKD